MRDRRTLILGGGGHSKVLIDMLRTLGFSNLGIIDPKLKIGSRMHEVEVLGNELSPAEIEPRSVDLVLGVGSVDLPKLRQEMFQRYSELNFNFVSLVHPTAILPSDFKPHSGVQIMAGSILQPGVQIGVNTIVNTGSRIDHDCHVGNHCHIAPGVTMSGNVTVGDLSHLGTGSIVIQSINIGPNTFIGAGAIVTQNIPAHSRVYGARATVIQNGNLEK